MSTASTTYVPTELISYRINHGKVVRPALLGGGAVLVVAAIIGAIFSPADFLHSYLGAYLFLFGLTVGCLGLTMLHHLTGGRWGDVIRPYTETGIKTIPLMFLLGLPILFGMKYIYPWTQPDAGGAALSAAVRWQHQVWQNWWFFSIRYVVYYVVLGFLGWGLLKKYKLRDEMAVQGTEHNTGTGYVVLSGPGFLVLVVVITFATLDWGMSVQAGWYSTLYGLLYVVGSGLTTFAFMTIVTYLITGQYERSHGEREGGHHHPMLSHNDWHDFGNLMFATTMLWGYMSLSQLLITYSGNLPQETVFYQYRSINGWEYVGGLLIVVHFVVPFLLLLQRDLKRNPKALVLLAVYVLVERQVDFYYQVHPSYTKGLVNDQGEIIAQVTSALGWHTPLHILAVIGMGGLWVAFFAWQLKDRRVLPTPAQEGHHHG